LVTRSEIVLIGPISAGKSTVGQLLGAALGVEHLDIERNRYHRRE
jgi:shikimate kinase